MITWLPSVWKYGKIIIVVILVGLLVNYVKEAEYAKKELVITKENASQERKRDSVGFSEVLLTKDEAIEELSYNRQDLVRELENQGIALKQLTKVVSSKTTYINNDTTTYLLNEILKGIYNKEPASQKVSDSTDCHTIEALLHFDGKDLKLDVTKIGFTSETDYVAYFEKKKWWPWHWFKKRKISITTLNSCGVTETRILNIQKRN